MSTIHHPVVSSKMAFADGRLIFHSSSIQSFIYVYTFFYSKQLLVPNYMYFGYIEYKVAS